ncbi:MAG: type II secretion system minor pseudopilin GspK [Moraxellaceae bacterium]|nr:type II secretion system minor pseudopilin GspK [Moraxellaceae bacterium]
MKKNPNNQSGVALLTVLLLVVSITVLAGVMVVGQSMTTRKTNLIFEQDRLAQQISTGEQLAIGLIQADNKLNKFDSLQDVWAKKIPPYKSEDGYTIELEIKDDSAKFNLNNLYHNSKADKQAFASLQNLLTILQIDKSLATAILDWQDPDNKVYNDTAEENAIYRNEKNNLPNNQPFIDINQLADLPNVTPEIIAKLKPYLTAVPYFLPVNVNTADEKVLTAIVGEEKRSMVQALIAKRTNQPIQNKAELNKFQLIDNSKKDNENKEEPKQTDDKNKQGEQPATENENPKKDEQKKDKKNNADKLLAVKSGVFSALVTVKNNSPTPKTGYATFKIAKGNFAHTNKVNETTTPTTSEEKESVQVFANQKWAFRPVF